MFLDSRQCFKRKTNLAALINFALVIIISLKKQNYFNNIQTKFYNEMHGTEKQKKIFGILCRPFPLFRGLQNDVVHVRIVSYDD